MILSMYAICWPCEQALKNREGTQKRKHTNSNCYNVYWCKRYLNVGQLRKLKAK